MSSCAKIVSGCMINIVNSKGNIGRNETIEANLLPFHLVELSAIASGSNPSSPITRSLVDCRSDIRSSSMAKE